MNGIMQKKNVFALSNVKIYTTDPFELSNQVHP